MSNTDEWCVIRWRNRRRQKTSGRWRSDAWIYWRDISTSSCSTRTFTVTDTTSGSAASRRGWPRYAYWMNDIGIGTCPSSQKLGNFLGQISCKIRAFCKFFTHIFSGKNVFPPPKLTELLCLCVWAYITKYAQLCSAADRLDIRYNMITNAALTYYVSDRPCRRQRT